MGYRGRKRRLKNFWKNAEEFVTHYVRTGKKTKEEHSLRILTKAQNKSRSGTRQRLVIKDKTQDLMYALNRQKQLVDSINAGLFKPKYFNYVSFNARIFEFFSPGIQEYFHKPNAEQLIEFIRARKEKRRSNIFGKQMSKEEYMLCKSFFKNPINKRISEKKIELAVRELLSFFGYDNKTFAHAQFQNVLIQGINRNGKLRLTYIDI